MTGSFLIVILDGIVVEELGEEIPLQGEKTMGRFFRFDSPLMTGLGKLADLIILSILWLLCCVPVITIVPSTAALYYVTLKMARKEEYRPIAGFFHALKDNLKQGSIMTLLFAAVGALLYIDYRIMTLQTEEIGSILKSVFLLLTVLAAAVMLYTFPLQAQFSNTILRTLKNAMILSLSKLPNTILLLALHSIPVWAVILSPEIVGKTLLLWLLLFPAAAAYLSSLRFVKIIAPLIETADPACA